MKIRRLKIKNRFRVGVVGLMLLAIITSGLGSLAALTGLFGGSGSESGDLTRGLVGYWSMDDAGGALVKDQSGQGNDGMLNDGGSGNPVSYWTFDETSGTTAADSIGSNNGTLAGSGSDPSWTNQGKAGGSLDFDGSGVGDYVTITNSSSMQFTTFSFEAWIYLRETGRIQRIVNGGSAFYDFRVTSGDDLEVELWTGAAWSACTKTADFLANRWYHVGVTHNNSTNTQTLYVDGSQVGTTCSITASTRYANVDIGGNQSSEGMNGFIDEVKIFNYVRAAAQIRTDYYESYKSKWVPGVADVAGRGAGSGLELDGINDFVDIPASSSLTFAQGSSFTVAAWCNKDASAGGDVVEMETGNSIPIRLICGSNVVLDRRDELSNNPTLTGSTALSIDTWYFVVGMVDASADQMRVYLNGVLDGSTGDSTSGTINSDNLVFGSRNTSSAFFDGSIDEVRIYNRALSVEEIRRLYNNRGPVAQWKFDEGAGRYAYDSSRKSEDITTDLRGYWSMNDGTGNASDASGKGNTATVTIGGGGTQTTVAQAWSNGSSGKSQGSVSFDGTDDYLTASDTASLSVTGTKLSISAWIYIDTNNVQHGIVEKYDGGSINGYVLRVNSSGKLLAGVADASGFNSFAGPTTLSTGQWYHVAMTYDGALITSYINGAVEASLASTKSITNGTEAFIIGGEGAGTPSSNTMDGKIDEVYIFARALNTDEIKYLYNLGYNTGTLGDATCQPGSGDCPTWSAENAPSVSGGSLDFDGTNDYVAVDDNNTLDMNNSNAMTVQAWVKPGAASQSNKWIIAKGLWGGDADGDYWLATTTSSNTFRFAVKTATNSYTVDKFVYSADQWYHLVGIYDGSSVQLYVDGVFQGSTTTAGALGANTHIIQIGGDPSANTLFNGNIDDARLYNYVRTADQIRLDYNAGLAAKFGGTPDLESGLVGEWKFDEMAGTTVYDSSGHGNTGTFTNNPTWAQGNTASQGLSGGGGALDFDGKNDYVTIEPSSNLDTNGDTQLTVAFWIYTAGQSSNVRIINKYVSGPLRGFNIDNQDPGVAAGVRFEVFDATGTIESITSTTAFDLNAWTHVVLTFQASATNGQKIYKNGVRLTQENTSITSIGNDSTAKLCFGANSGCGNANFDGMLDDVRIYNRVLTAEEIRYLYNNNGPLAQWKLDEGSGSTAYDSIGSNDGTLTNMEAADWVAGKFGAALDFDGSNEYITRADQGASDPLRVSGDITVATWIKPDTLSGNDHVVNKEQGTGGYVLGTTGSNIYVAYSSGTETEVTGSATLSTGQWQHIAFTYDGANIRTYLNGVLDKVTAKTGYATSSQAFVIGSDNDGGVSAPFDGYIDDVRLYNYVRTQEQLRADYNAGLAAKFGGTPDLQRGLIAYWDFDESAGSLVQDRSGNGNDGMFNDGGSGNPVSYWDLEDGTGQSATDRIGSNNGTLGASSSASTDDPAWTSGGRIGKALEFDGVADYLDIPTSATTQITGSLSVSFWAKRFAGSTGGSLVIKESTGASGDYWINNPGTGSITCNSNGGSGSANTGVAMEQNQWYHIALTLAVDSLKCYVNGELKATDTSTAAEDGIGTATSIFWGRTIGGGAGNYFAGALDDMRLYNYVLTDSSVKKIYQESATSKRAPGSIPSTEYNGLAGGGNAITLDGADDHISVPDSSTLNPSSFSTSFWVKKNSEPDDFDHVVNKFKNPVTRQGWQVGFTSSGVMNPRGLYFSVWNTLGNEISNSTLGATLAVGTWRFYTYTFNGSTLTYYEDGVSRGTVSMAGTTFQTSSNPFSMGALANGTGNFGPITLDDVRYYDRAISAEEVRYLYNNNGPVGHWKLDENAGTTAYDSAGSNDGTLTNMEATDWVAGKFGTALDFDGSNEYVDLGTGLNSSLVRSKSFSGSAWIKVDSLASQRDIITNADATTPFIGIEFLIETDGDLRFDINQDATKLLRETATAGIATNTWYHVAWTYTGGQDATGLRLYLNGVELSTTVNFNTMDADATSVTNLQIGARDGTSTPFDGKIDDVRVYNYVRSAAQIQADYNAGKSLYFR